MTTADLAPALQEVEAKLAGARLVAEFAHGTDSRDLDRAMATWHPRGVLTFAPDTVLDGLSSIKAFLERNWAAYPEIYHWYTNLSTTVTGEATMRIECRVAALCRDLSGTTVHQVGTSIFECIRENGDWLISREAVTIQYSEPAV